MASCTFTNLMPEQAEALAHWFTGVGEQYFYDHLECGFNIPAPTTDVQAPGWLRIDEDGNVTVLCRTP